jgi:hypothetical protein
MVNSATMVNGMIQYQGSHFVGPGRFPCMPDLWVGLVCEQRKLLTEIKVK